MKQTKSRIGSQRKGQMPMALIAVALLMAGTFYGIVYADIEKGTANSDSANVEYCTVDEAVEHAVSSIEGGIGRIITDISGSGSGTLMDRSEAFGKSLDEMFESEFPNSYRGVRTQIEDSCIRLGLENMKLGDGEVLGGDTRASYITASGTVDLLLTSESTVTRKTVDISANATSALPLLAEASTRFELSTEGSGSALSQMVEYQLNALASNRILNGYGMYSRGGDFGTSSIITESDVSRAVRNALNILEAMCFRDCDEEDFLTHVFCDLGDLIVVEDGCLVIDLGALYSQALMQNLDEYVGQWIEYIGYDVVLDVVDVVVDNLKKTVDFIRNLVDKDATKKDAIEYIKRQMSNAGYSESDYRYFNSGEFVFDFGELSYYVGEGTDLTLRTFTPEPIAGGGIVVDVLDWDGWSGFLEYYRSISNAFRDSLSLALKTVASNSVGKGVVKIPIDCYDQTTFSEEVEKYVRSAVSGEMDSFIDYSAASVRTCRVTDPVMYEAYRSICRNQAEIFQLPGGDEFARSMAMIVCLNNIGLPTQSTVDQLAQQIKDDCDEFGVQYNEKVEAFVDHLSIFLDATKGPSLSEGLAKTIGGFLRKLDLESMVGDTVINLCIESASMSNINSYAGITELPGSDSFTLRDGDGKTHTEKLSVSDSLSLDIRITDPTRNGDRNMHYIGFFEDRTARYSSVFTVDVKGTVDYAVRGTNPVYEMLGLYDSGYSGSVNIDCRMNISCMSGWALSGVSYQKSNTAIEDLAEVCKKFILSLIEEIFGPLEVIMKGFGNLVDICTTAVVEFGNYLSQMMERIYEAIAIPMDFLYDQFDKMIQDLMENIGLEDIVIKLGSQTFVFNLYGMKVTIETNLRSLQKTTKEFVTITAEKEVAEDVTIAASLAFRQNAAAGNHIIVNGGVSGNDWSVNMKLDPMMSSKSYFAQVSGYVRDVQFSGNFPEVVQYQILEISTSDIPGIGAGLNNIPLPALGLKCSVELGLYVKYNLPVEKGLLINEVELNPEGNDAGKEWVEIYNNTDSEVDLMGYTLVPSCNEKKSLSLGDIVLSPGDRTVVYFPSQCLNNSGGAGSKSGTKISLYDTYGNLCDRTPALKDTENNDYTWQRTYDGSVNWSFMPGTEGGKNNGDFPGGMMLKTMIIDFAKDAAVEVLDEMGDVVQGTDQFMEYAERVMARITEKFIDSVSGSLVEACAYVKAELTDYAQTQHYGIKVMVGVDSNLVHDVLTYIAAMIPVIGDHIDCPEGLSGENILYQDVFLKVMLYTGVSAPKVLGNVVDSAEVETSISVKFNISAVSTLFGEQKGKWKVEAGIVAEDVPTALIPKCFNAEKYMKSDFWLLRMVFEEKTS